jgi:hypothetical protein
MKAFIFDPLWDELVADDLLEKLNKSDIEYVVTKEIAALSDCKELFEGEEKRLSLLLERDSKQGRLKHLQKEHQAASLGLINLTSDIPDSSMQVIKDDLQDKIIQINKVKSDIAAIDTKLQLSSDFEFTIDEFLNLVKLAPDKMRAGSAVEKDRVARILFLNLTVDNEKRVSPIWKEPFASLVKAIEMSSGGILQLRSNLF